MLRKHCKEGASVATQFLIHVSENFQKNPKIAKKTLKIQKNTFFNIFAPFLAFSASSKKNLNFQRSFERVQLFTRHFDIDSKRTHSEEIQVIPMERFSDVMKTFFFVLLLTKI